MACLVSLSDTQQDSKSIAVSGLSLGNGSVLTVGLGLVPLLKESHVKTLLCKPYHSFHEFEALSCFLWFDRLFLSSQSNHRNLMMRNCSEVEANRFQKIPGKIACVFKSEKFAKVLERTFPSHAKWNFLDMNKTAKPETNTFNLSADEIRNLLSYFIIIETTQENNHNY